MRYNSDDVDVLDENLYEKFLSPLKWDGETLHLLHQKLLPEKEEWITVKTVSEVFNSIKNMVVRGAPAIGITGGFGVLFAVRESASENRGIFWERLQIQCDYLKSARPTAINLKWAIDLIVSKIKDLLEKKEIDEIIAETERLVLDIWKKDIQANIQMGNYGKSLIPKGASILTHCNAGAIATGGFGTALGVIRAAFGEDSSIHVYSNETRPWLQGARLTAWELKKLNIPVTLIPDVVAGYLMSLGEIDVVIVGADRISQNGDVANKIGTYTMAILANYHKIPFYVAAPLSTFDLSIEDGKAIPIEERNKDEVLYFSEKRVAPPGINARNPVFDITPNKLINAIITEKGIINPPYPLKIKDLFH